MYSLSEGGANPLLRDLGDQSLISRSFSFGAGSLTVREKGEGREGWLGCLWLGRMVKAI